MNVSMDAKVDLGDVLLLQLCKTDGHSHPRQRSWGDGREHGILLGHEGACGGREWWCGAENGGEGVRPIDPVIFGALHRLGPIGSSPWCGDCRRRTNKTVVMSRA